MNERRDLGDGSGRTALVDGSVVGGYTVSYLDAGGMSCVYKGEFQGETYVLKEVDAGNTREVPSLLSEKGLLERLDHPGVVRFYSFFNENGYYYLVLEYVPGRPLSQYLAGGKGVEPEVAADWGVQLCEIFTYLHAQNPPVIYRDLKSENILLHDGKIKLIDFGIARLHKGVRAKDTELMGSPATASPEHYGGAETDARSDIYTIGATLYEQMTGGRRKQVGAFQFAPVRELNEKVSPELEEVLTKATHFQPDERYQSTQELRDALLKALGRPIPSTKAQTNSAEGAPIPASQSKRSPALALLTLAVIGLLGWQGYQWHKAKQSPFYGGPVPSRGTFEANLTADIFAADEVEGRAAVMLGEDIGLFQVTASGKTDKKTRARLLAKRLNAMYHSACKSCGGTGLEPEDIKVGRHDETDQVVVFYAHMHGDDTHWGPELLATVDEVQAKALEVTPRFVAGYWRDLVRDTVNISRGIEVPDSVMGSELSSAILKGRSKLKEDAEQLTALRAVLSELGGKQSLKLRGLFLEVPDKKPTPDRFEKVEGYSALTL